MLIAIVCIMTIGALAMAGIGKTPDRMRATI
jgi:hypothetical protein